MPNINVYITLPSLIEDLHRFMTCSWTTMVGDWPPVHQTELSRHAVTSSLIHCAERTWHSHLLTCWCQCT